MYCEKSSPLLIAILSGFKVTPGESEAMPGLYIPVVSKLWPRLSGSEVSSQSQLTTLLKAQSSTHWLIENYQQLLKRLQLLKSKLFLMLLRNVREKKIL